MKGMNSNHTTILREIKIWRVLRKAPSFKLSYHSTSLNFDGGNWVYKYPIRGGLDVILPG